MESSSSAEEGRGSCFSNEGTAEPRIEDMISRINELQQAKKIANKELCETQAHRQSLQKQLDELSLEETQLKEILSKKQETLRMLHLQCQEKETEALRMEFGQQLEEWWRSIKTLWEFHKVDKLSQEMSNINNNKEQLLMEERLTLKKLESIQKQLDRLTPPEAKTEAVAVTSIDAFLCSEEAAAAVQLFEEENKKATEFLEAASLRYHQLQQKYQRLKRELEAVGHCAIGGSKERSPEEAAEGEGGIATNVGERETVMEIPRMQKKDQEFRPGPGEHPSSLGPSSS